MVDPYCSMCRQLGAVTGQSTPLSPVMMGDTGAQENLHGHSAYLFADLQ